MRVLDLILIIYLLSFITYLFMKLRKEKFWYWLFECGIITYYVKFFALVGAIIIIGYYSYLLKQHLNITWDALWKLLNTKL